MKLLTNLKNKIELAKQAADNKMYWDSVARLVSPSTIKEFPEYILIDNRLMARCVIVGIPPCSDIGGYPQDMAPSVIDELLAISTTGNSIAFSFAIQPISNVDAMKMIDEALFKNKVTQESYRKVDSNTGRQDNKFQPPMKKVLEEGDFMQNYEKIFKNEQKMYHTAFIVIIWGMDMQSIREAESHVRIVLEANRIYYEFPDYRHQDTFLAAQPYPLSVKFSWVELFSYHASALVATRNPNSRTDDTGLYFGEDMKTGKTIQIDLKTMSANHLMFVGPTGSGKTFTLLMLLMRTYDMLGKRIIYTTPKADVTTNYRNVAKYYGKTASIIDIGPSGSNINPLQMLIDENVLGNNLNTWLRAFDEHMELLDQFFAVLFEGTKTINMSNYINETLMEVYRSKGIYRDDPKTWKNATFPTMQELRQIWQKDAERKNVTAQALVDKTFMVNTSWSYMNKPTDVNVSADFIIIDISDVPSSLQDAMNVFVTGIMGMRFKTDVKKETIIAVDEAAVFLRHPKLSKFLLKTLTQGRSYNLSLWLSTQQTADLVKANLDEEFKTNIAISIVLGNMRKDTMEHVKSFFKLDEHNILDLMSCGVGEGLLIVGHEIIPVKFKPTEHEKRIIKGKQVDEIVERETALELIDETLRKLVAEHQICFSSWLKSDQSMMLKQGFTSHRIQNALGLGPIQVWMKNLNGNGDGKIGNQTLDHYATVLQVAGHLTMHQIKVEVNHNDDVDIVADINGNKVAFEYERPKIHTFDQLIKKKEFAENKYGKVVFIGQTSNVSDLVSAVGEQNVVRRGTELLEFITELLAQTVTN